MTEDFTLDWTEIWNFCVDFENFSLDNNTFFDVKLSMRSTVLREKAKGVANNELQTEARVFPQLAEFLIEPVTP